MLPEKLMGNAAQGGGKRGKMEENKVGFNKKVIIGIAAVVAVIALLAAIYAVFRQKPVEGSKQITIEVVNKEQKSTNYAVNTNAEFLRQAMEEAEGLTFEGQESEFGMMVESINGEIASYETDGAYWSFYVNGEYCNYGIDTQLVLDGDAFKIEYTPAQ